MASRRKPSDKAASTTQKHYLIMGERCLLVHDEEAWAIISETVVIINRKTFFFAETLVVVES